MSPPGPTQLDYIAIRIKYCFQRALNILMVMTAACSKGTGDWGSRYRHCRAVFTTPLIIELKALKRNENYFLGDAFINLLETLTFVKRGVGRSQCKMASLNATKPSLKIHDLLTASLSLYLNLWFELFASVLPMLLRKSNPLECLVFGS